MTDDTTDDTSPTAVAAAIAERYGDDAEKVEAGLRGERGPTARRRAMEQAREVTGDTGWSVERGDDGRPYAKPPDGGDDARWKKAIPTRFHDASVRNLDTDRKTQLVEAWHDQPDRNLLLLGPVGVGKTYTAVAAARSVWGDGWQTVVFRDVGAMCREMVPYGPDPVVEQAIHVDLLILDGLGDEPLTDYKIGRVYDIVNRRWLERRPIIVTSNLSVTVEQVDDALGLGDEPGSAPMVAAVGERTVSRLCDGAIIGVFPTDEPDRRT